MKVCTKGIMKHSLTQLAAGIIALTISTQSIGESIAGTVDKSFGQGRIDDSLYITGQKPRIPEPNIIPFQRLEEIVDSLNHVTPIPELIHDKYILSFIYVESEDDASKVSDAGASGLMQLRPAAWRTVMPDSIPYYPNVFNPELNITAGRRYLKKLYYTLKREYSGWNELTYQHKLDLIAAAYNAGPTLLSDKGFDILSMPFETRNHIRKINVLLDPDYVFDYYRESDPTIAIGDSLNPDFPRKYTMINDSSDTKIVDAKDLDTRRIMPETKTIDSSLVYAPQALKDSLESR